MSELTDVVASQKNERLAIIDIGSNSVRLVVYKGLTRTPAPLYNEKVMAGLGRGLQKGGLLDPEAVETAIQALQRFHILAQAIGVGSLRAVATAAVRDAADGPEFIRRVRDEIGIAVEVIDSDTEGLTSALGVISGVPGASGIMGDLGGGSLELVQIADGRAGERISLPLGALRLADLCSQSPDTLETVIEAELDRAPWSAFPSGQPFYAVGGSWRALGQLHRHLMGWSLPVLHQYQMASDAPQQLIEYLTKQTAGDLKKVPAISKARIPQLPGTALLLKKLVERAKAPAIVISAFGLREGLLYSALSPDIAREDPLIASAHEIARRTGRFDSGDAVANGEALLKFTDAIFPGEEATLRRIRHASCLLADSVWRAHPDMRAERGLDTALHGNWIGIDATGRAMLATTLWAVNNGSPRLGPPAKKLDKLASAKVREHAWVWGQAIRFGRRFSGGVKSPLAAVQVERTETELRFALPASYAALYSEVIARRHQTLARHLGLEASFQILR